ncbi:kinase-like domain-containing protein [Parasitella parasitica]|nr:kinase-like domain-containing protein [Parasitella parasitica]
MKAVENILSERRLLEHIDYSLIVNLRYAFQDDENLFMVLDLMLGGDLRFHLDRLGSLPENYVQFYAAELALSLNFLHTRNIIHRDLKPDNILLDEKGHAHLTDFNIAVPVDPQRTRPLTTIAGSFAYISPEILLKQGYSYPVDWWSLGIVLYELLYGQRPFKAKSNEDLQQAILFGSIEFPKEPQISNDAMDFIMGLLNRDASQRLGVGEAGFDRLKKHPWMKDICWDILASKAVGAPFTPDQKRSNFDPTHELEEILLEENPLRVKKRKPKTNASNEDLAIPPAAMSAEQLLEQYFVAYNYTKPQQRNQNIFPMSNHQIQNNGNPRMVSLDLYFCFSQICKYIYIFYTYKCNLTLFPQDQLCTASTDELYPTLEKTPSSISGDSPLYGNNLEMSDSGLHRPPVAALGYMRSTTNPPFDVQT